jgi:deoxyhypusine synthase
VSWGKIDPERLPDTVVCYVDSTVALPLITAYALARRKPRKPRRLYEQRERMLAEVTRAYEKVRRKTSEAKRNEQARLYVGRASQTPPPPVTASKKSPRQKAS